MITTKDTKGTKLETSQEGGVVACLNGFSELQGQPDNRADRSTAFKIHQNFAGTS